MVPLRRLVEYDGMKLDTAWRNGLAPSVFNKHGYVPPLWKRLYWEFQWHWKHLINEIKREWKGGYWT
jgi:hypothetical protein